MKKVTSQYFRTNGQKAKDIYRRSVCPSQQASNTVGQGTADKAQAAVRGRRKWHIDEIYDLYIHVTVHRNRFLFK